MSEMMMRERVARAICKSQFDQERDWQFALPEADAAIAAMREPTESMFLSPGVGAAQESSDALEAWRLMVDFALTEREDTYPFDNDVSDDEAKFILRGRMHSNPMVEGYETLEAAIKGADNAVNWNTFKPVEICDRGGRVIMDHAALTKARHALED